MHDVRLAVSYPDEATRVGIAARLRGATVVPWAPGDRDAVMLCGAAHLCEQLLGGGAPVLLVADPCPTADAMESLFATARTSGVPFAVVNLDRYLPSRQLIKKQLAGPLGEPGLIRSHRWEPPSADRASDPAALPDALLRDLDVALWLAGRAPNRVYATGQKAEGAADRCIQVHLGFANGGMALLDYTNRLPPGDGYQSLSVIASSGAAYADDHQNAQLLYCGGNAQAVRTKERAGQLASVAQEFVDALRAGQNLSASATDWHAVFALAKIVQKSLASGRAVEVEAL